jgi:anti-anti-sigma regulatory factor
MGGMEMNLNTERRADDIVIRVLDREATARQGAGAFLWDALEELAAHENGTNTKTVTLDIGAVRYADTAMIGSILQLRRRLKLDERELRIERACPLVITMMKLVGNGQVTSSMFVSGPEECQS